MDTLPATSPPDRLHTKPGWSESGPFLFALTSIVIALALALGCALADAVETRWELSRGAESAQEEAYVMLAIAGP